MVSDGEKMLLFGGVPDDEEVEYSANIYSLKQGDAEWNLEETKLSDGMGMCPQGLKIKPDTLNC